MEIITTTEFANLNDEQKEQVKDLLSFNSGKAEDTDTIVMDAAKETIYTIISAIGAIKYKRET